MDENTTAFLNLMRSADELLYDQDFIDIEEQNEVLNNDKEENATLTNKKFVFSKSPLDFVTTQSLKTLVNFGINISFMRYNAFEWPRHESFVNGIKMAKNIKSTSIYTEQLVGRISRLHDSCLLKNKNELNSLAITAVDNSEN